MGVGAVERRYSRRSVAADLASLEKSLWGKTYDTTTRGYMQCFPSSGENPRLSSLFKDKTQSHVQTGAYAIVKTDTKVMSKRETSGISHFPSSSERGNVQSSLGIYSTSSFASQVKNPHAPTTRRQVRTDGAGYPACIMRDVFGAAGQGQYERRAREP